LISTAFVVLTSVVFPASRLQRPSPSSAVRRCSIQGRVPVQALVDLRMGGISGAGEHEREVVRQLGAPSAVEPVSAARRDADVFEPQPRAVAVSVEQDGDGRRYVFDHPTASQEVWWLDVDDLGVDETELGSGVEPKMVSDSRGEVVGHEPG